MTEHQKNSHHHIVPVKSYVMVFTALLMLTFLTVVVSRFDFGSWNLIVALLVAFCKASLVVSVFMGLKYERGFNMVAFVGSILFLLIFIGLTVADVQYRYFGDPVENQTDYGIKSPVKKPVLKPAESSE